jgi:hypothetical protein
MPQPAPRQHEGVSAAAVVCSPVVGSEEVRSPVRPVRPNTSIQPASECQQTPSSPNAENLRDTSHYVQSELESLELIQQETDREASSLEPRLRTAIHSGNKVEEEILLQQWFALVNKKNALIRRQMQLNILEKEDDLEKRYELLKRELRQFLVIEDLNKTDAQKKREKMLLEELVSVVNQRNELVQHLDSQERAIEEDIEMEKALKEKLNAGAGCSMQ